MIKNGVQAVEHLHGYTEKSPDELASDKPLPPPPTNKIKTYDRSDEHERNDGHVQYRGRQPDALKIVVRDARHQGRHLRHRCAVCRAKGAEAPVGYSELIGSDAIATNGEVCRFCGLGGNWIGGVCVEQAVLSGVAW